MNLGELGGKNKEELLTIAKEMGIENVMVNIRKDEVVFLVMQKYAEKQGYILAAGLLEIINDGYPTIRINVGKVFFVANPQILINNDCSCSAP